MREEQGAIRRSGIPPIVYVIVASAIIPVNFFAVFIGLGVESLHTRLSEWILFSVLAAAQLAAGIAAGVSGTRRWRSRRSTLDLLLAIAGWMLALAAVIGWAGGMVLATVPLRLRM